MIVAWTHSPRDTPSSQETGGREDAGYFGKVTVREMVGEDNKHLEGCSDEEGQEEAPGGGQRWRQRGPRGVDVGGLDLRGEEGGEGDVGDQGGAGVVDEGIDLLRLLTAGFHLEDTRSQLRTSFNEN